MDGHYAIVILRRKATKDLASKLLVRPTLLSGTPKPDKSVGRTNVLSQGQAGRVPEPTASSTCPQSIPWIGES